MALTREEMDRLRRVQRELDLLRRQETERGVREIGRLYDRVLREVTAGLDEIAMASDETELENAFRRVMRLGQKGLADVETEARGIIERLIGEASRRGFEAPIVLALATVLPAAGTEELVRIVERLEQAGQRPGSLIRIDFGHQSLRVTEQIKRKVYQDGLNLSARLHRRTLLQQQEFERLLTEGIERGRAAVKLAREIEAVGGIAPELPKYLERVVKAARSGDRAAFQKAFDEAVRIARTRKKGPLGVQGMTKQLLSRLRRANAEEINQVVQDYLKRKARYHATVVARHETNEAYRAAFKEASADKPWVKGLKFNLSRSHPQEDECDDLATQDLYGLGPGGYPVGQYPETPHPQCLCYMTEIIDQDYFTGDVKRRLGEDAKRARTA